MDKKEILEKSQQENQFSDERDRQIELKACKAAYHAVIIVNAGIALLLTLQQLSTGSSCIDWRPFLLTVLLSQSFHDLTIYRRQHKALYLLSGLIGAAAFLAWILVVVKGGF